MATDDEPPGEAAASVPPAPLTEAPTLAELVARSGELDARIAEHLRLLGGR